MGAQSRFSGSGVSFGLTVVMLLAVIWSLQSSNWAPGLEILNWVVLFAALAGWLLARTPLPGVLAHPLAFLAGIGWTAWLSLRFFPELETWQEQLTELVIRVVLWVQAAMSGGMSADNLIFVLEMSILFWLISYTAVWHLFRTNNIWAVLVPAGTAILVNTYYSQQGLNFYLSIYIVVAFLLVIRTHLTEQEAEWRRHGVAYNPDLATDFLRDGAIFAVTVMLLAWMVPSAVEKRSFNPVLARLSGPLGEAQQTWTRLFSSLNYQRAAATGSWFSRSMTFQGPLQLSDEAVMEVETTKGWYWRAVAHDRYSSAGWSTTDPATVNLEGDAPSIPGLPSPADALRTVVPQKYTIFIPPGNLIFAAAQPMQVMMPTRMVVAGPAREVPGATETAMVQLYTTAPLYIGQQYSVVSAVSTADEQSLRAAGEGYPDYIRAHYTALPETVPERVRELAVSLTADQQNPYDKAKAVESYLRSIPYDEKIPGPRPGEDGVDYFLFRERAGYCDYYASSMAVLLRSVGIPARIVRGYASGDPDPERPGVYQVRQRDAHTWVEVYFPQYGWIEFEPTAAEPGITRPAAPPTTGEEGAPAPAPNMPPDRLNERDALLELGNELAEGEGLSGWRRLVPGVRWADLRLPVGILSTVALIGGVVALALRRRWRDLSIVERVFDQLSLTAQMIGIKQRPVQTPSEYVEEIAVAVPTVRDGLERLGRAFSRLRFGPLPVDRGDEEQVTTTWQQVRLPLLLGAVARRIRSLVERTPGVRR